MAFAYFLLVLIADENRSFIFTSFIILGFADSSAAIVGQKYSKSFFNLTNDRKSIIGSAAFFLVSILSILLSIMFLEMNSQNPFFSQNLFDLLWLSIIISILLTFIEAISSYGSDNLFIPLFASLLLYIFSIDDGNYLAPFTLALLLAAIVSVLSYRAKFLTLNGSVATFLLAIFVLGLGGWKWAIPITTFFVFSSLLSKVRKSKNRNIEQYFEKSGIRDIWQVLANGGLAGILVILHLFFPSQLLFYIYLGSLAAVCSDTWATEFGTLNPGKTYNVLNFKLVQPGVSGGVSLLGTIGAALGGLIIALSGLFWSEIGIIFYFALIILSGLFGSFLDSLLGATIQHQRKCSVCEKVTERKYHCKRESDYLSGVVWFKNDVVNLFAGIAGSIFILIILSI
ncbi:MAG: DUF92 domain-containing protein [Melioribacteraceae bacterium]|nr:DUF92 domain-containing protein [Melioribacteraceae bacterium]MCF8265017.1 DUF92 domain-containing protein [Melioribacteraceae bacterium]